MNRLRGSKFWNVIITEDQDLIDAVVNKWCLMFVLQKEDLKELRHLSGYFSYFSDKIFDPSILREYNLKSYDLQKDWIALRAVIISNYYKSCITKFSDKEKSDINVFTKFNFKITIQIFLKNQYFILNYIFTRYLEENIASSLLHLEATFADIKIEALSLQKEQIDQQTKQLDLD
jgi:hypothetical protein